MSLHPPCLGWLSSPHVLPGDGSPGGCTRPLWACWWCPRCSSGRCYPTRLQGGCTPQGAPPARGPRSPGHRSWPLSRCIGGRRCPRQAALQLIVIGDVHSEEGYVVFWGEGSCSCFGLCKGVSHDCPERCVDDDHLRLRMLQHVRDCSWLQSRVERKQHLEVD